MTEPLDSPSLDSLRIPPRRRQNPWHGRVLAFITCVLVFEALFGEQGLAQTVRARHERSIAAATVARLRNENAGLREQIRRLQEDPATIESVARQDLGLIRPGEILVVVKDVR
jgi:cell division protein FtsB